jgi:hypothetical protein
VVGEANTLAINKHSSLPCWATNKASWFARRSWVDKNLEDSALAIDKHSSLPWWATNKASWFACRSWVEKGL